MKGKKAKTTRKKHVDRRVNRRNKRGKKYDEDEETEIFEIATGENAPMFWGDVDKKLLRKNSRSKTTRAKKGRR